MKLKNFMNPAEGILRMAADAGVAVGGIGTGTASVEQAKTVSTRTGDDIYLRNDLEKKLVLIAPSATPIDTITREIGNTRKTRSIETGGWEIATRDIDDKVYSQTSSADVKYGNVVVTKPLIWKAGDTFVAFDTTVGAVNLYVDSVTVGTPSSGLATLACHRIGASVFPQIAANSKIIRLGKAMSELDAQAAVLYSTPTNRTNYCQIHMAQVEESVIHQLHEKEVALDFATMKEQTIFDLKWRMEMTNLWGKKDYFTNTAGDPIYTSDGLWNQIDQTLAISNSAMTQADWIAFTKNLFSGNNGSDRRIAVVGPELMAFWANVPSIQKQLDANSVEVVLGVKFQRIITNFGELLVKCADNTFLGDHAFNGIVIDPAYIRRDVYEQMQSTPLDLDATGQRRVKAERILENYCLYVENQPVHAKVVATPTTVPVGAKLETPRVSLTALAATSATLTLLEAVSGADSYKYSLNGGAWTTFTSGSAITGLSASTNYTIKVKALPASASTLYVESDSAEVAFKTPAA